MAPTAESAVLCGDPARALAVAQDLMDQPRMSNHHRGLWGYYGTVPSGAELTVHATGIGGVGAAIVLGELARRGVKQAMRVGTAWCGGDDPVLGSTLAVTSVEARDGTSEAYGIEAGGILTPDPELTRGLEAACDGRIELVSRARPDPGGTTEDGVQDLQSAGLLAAAAELGVRVGVGVIITRNDRGPLHDDPLEAASLKLARAALQALGARSPWT